MLEVHRNGGDTDTIACLYYALKECGRIDEVLYAGHDLLYWLNLFNTKNYYLCSIDGQIVGFGIVNEIAEDARRAEVSFAFLPTCSARNALRLGKMALTSVFTDESRTQYVYGTTPVKNAMGWRFGKMIGMKIVGITPNYVTYKGEDCDAVITYAEREEYLNGRAATKTT